MTATRTRLLRHAPRHRLRRLTTTARTPTGDGSGWALAGAVASEGRRPGGRGARAPATRRCAARGAKPLEPGVYPVVLEPAAVAGLLGFLPLDARHADEGRSAFSKPGGGSRVGEKMLGTLNAALGSVVRAAAVGAVRLRGHAAAAGVVGRRRDAEEAAHLALLGEEDGARRPMRATPATVPTGPKDASRSTRWWRGIERGLVVTRFWYIRMLEPQTVDGDGADARRRVPRRERQGRRAR